MEQTFLITFSSGKIIILHKQNKFDNSLVVVYKYSANTCTLLHLLVANIIKCMFLNIYWIKSVFPFLSSIRIIIMHYIALCIMQTTINNVINLKGA